MLSCVRSLTACAFVLARQKTDVILSANTEHTDLGKTGRYVKADKLEPPNLKIAYQSDDGAIPHPRTHAVSPAASSTPCGRPLSAVATEVMELKFDIGGKTGQQVNVQAEYQVSNEVSLGVSVNGPRCLMGKVEFNDPSLLTCELNGGITNGEFQLPYNIGVCLATAGVARFVVLWRASASSQANACQLTDVFHSGGCRSVSADCSAPGCFCCISRAAHGKQVDVQKPVSGHVCVT